MTPEQQKMVDSKLYTRQPESEPPVRSGELGSALVWSRDYPKQPGQFWMRHHGKKKEIVLLTGIPGNLKQMFAGVRIGLHNLPKYLCFQWAGPIPEPQEPNASDQRPGDQNA